MKKLLSMAMVMALAFSIVSCGSKEEAPATETPAATETTETAPAATETTETAPATETTETTEATDAAAYADGTFKAEDADFDPNNGFKSFVEVTIEGGQITAVNYDGINADGALKSEVSESGEYGMVEKGGAIAEWHEQAALVEEAAVASQGVVDTVSGVTIDLTGFTTLFNDALSQAKN